MKIEQIVMYKTPSGTLCPTMKEARHIYCKEKKEEFIKKYNLSTRSNPLEWIVCNVNKDFTYDKFLNDLNELKTLHNYAGIDLVPAPF